MPPIPPRWFALLGGSLITVMLVIITTTAIVITPSVNRGETRPTAVATPTVVIPRGTITPKPIAQGNDWTQYRFDLAGTGFNPEGIITSANVAALTQKWSITRSPGFYSTPAIVNGVIYVTTGASLYAYDLTSGAPRWHFDVPNEKRGGIHSSVAVDPVAHLAFFGTPEARFYAVDTTTGKQKWQLQLADPGVGSFIWSSPLVANGKVYIGIASQNDDPCVRGAAIALNEQTGKTAWKHYMVAAGALGGSIWSSITADPAHQEVIATTGNPCPLGPVYNQGDAIVALDWNTGATRWTYTALANDTDDFDFGEGAVNFTYQGHQYVVGGNKYGKIYAISPQSNGTARLAWSYQLADPDTGDNGGGIFEPPAYANGILVFAGGPPPDKSCPLGSLKAFQPDTGKVLWKVCTDGRLVGPAAISADVIFVGQDHRIAAYSLTTGERLWTQVRQGPSWGGVAISHGYVVAGTVPGALYCYQLVSGYQ